MVLLVDTLQLYVHLLCNTIVIYVFRVVRFKSFDLNHDLNRSKKIIYL